MTKKVISITLALIMLLGACAASTAQAADIKILMTKTLNVGQTANVSLTDPNTGAKLDTIWESTDPSIATVTSSGKVTGKKAGTCIVTTWWNSKLYGVKVTVKAAAKKISLSKKSASLTVGKTITLKLKNAKASKVKWTTSNKKVATVSKGKVKAKKAGKATITAKYGKKKYTCKITVKKKAQVSAYSKLANYIKKNGTKSTDYGATDYTISWKEDGYVLWTNYRQEAKSVNVAITVPTPNAADCYTDFVEGIYLNLYKSGKRSAEYWRNADSWAYYEKIYKKGSTVNTAKLKLKYKSGPKLSTANTRARALSKAGMSLWNKFLKARVGLNMKKLGFIYKK